LFSIAVQVLCRKQNFTYPSEKLLAWQVVALTFEASSLHRTASGILFK